MTNSLYQLSKSYSAKRLAKGALVCPACQLRIDDPVLSCPACGFNGQQTLQMFSGQAPPMQPILDMAGHWNPAQTQLLEKKIAVMRRLFPQIHWCVLSVVLPADVDVRLFGFWFFNVSAVADAQEATERSWTILLILDENNHRVAVTPGYAVEPFVADDEWETALLSMYASWKNGDSLGACAEFFQQIKAVLIKASGRVKELIARNKGGEG